MKRVTINIFGKVQMVGFRFSTLQKAEELEINGFVRNLRDGTVEIEAEGEEEKIEKLIEWSKIGPPYADVVKVIVEDIEINKEYKSFDIL